MLEILQRLIDTLFPPRPNERILRSTTVAAVRQLASVGRFDKHLFLLRYEHPVVRALMIENKFRHSEKAANLLATVLTDWLERRPDKVVCIPIPLGRERLRTRGYNQVSEVLRRVSHSRMTIFPLLTRCKETAPQTELSRAARLQNMKEAFVLHPKEKRLLQPDTHYVLIDDVVTTGATLTAARAALDVELPAGCMVTTLALAH